MAILGGETQRHDESAKACLKRLRSSTCYSGLRSLVLVVLVIAILALLVSVFYSATLIGKGMPLLACYGIVSGSLAIFLAGCVCYYVGNLLADIADAQIEQTRRR